MWRRRSIIDGIDEIEREIDELFEELLYGRPMWKTEDECLEPLAYINETEGDIIVTVDLPFVRKEDIKLDVTPNLMKVEAKMQRHIVYDRWGTVQRKCRFRAFHKEVKLPSEVIPELAKAVFKNGYLTVELPKKVRRHKIEIE